MKSIIFDLGSNCGASLSYYMLKADVVVAVEANPILCRTIRESFSACIRLGQLIVENCVVTRETDKEKVNFYIHKSHSPLSQFPKPSEDKINDFEAVKVPAKSIEQLIKTYGMPFYIKIDLERYDQYILQALITSKLLPEFVSAEIQDLKVIDLLLDNGFYNAFKLVDGKTIHIQYKNLTFMTGKGGRPAQVSFPRYSSGPFGDDIHGKWMNANTIRNAILLEGTGWKDLHATRFTDIRADQYLSLLSYLAHRAIARCSFYLNQLVEGTKSIASKLLNHN